MARWVWSEDSFQELVLPFYYIGYRLGNKHLYLLNHIAGPQAPQIVFEFHLDKIARGSSPLG